MTRKETELKKEYGMYAALFKQKKQTETKLAGIKERMAKIESIVLEEMTESGVASMNIKDVTLYIKRELWAGVVRGEDETSRMAQSRACEFLDEFGLGHLYALKVNTQGLSAYFREEDKKGTLEETLKPMEKGLKCTEVFKIGARRSA